MADLEFKRNLAFEDLGRRRWPGHREAWGPEATLHKYWSSEDAIDEDDWLGRRVLSTYEIAYVDELAKLTLSYEQACESVDVLPMMVDAVTVGLGETLRRRAQELLAQSDRKEALPVLFDLLEEVGIGTSIQLCRSVEAALRALRLLHWVNATSHHAQSIEGDYELFSGFDVQLIESDPWSWTRSALNSVCWAIEIESTGDEEEYRSDAPEELRMSEEHWELAMEFISALDLASDDRLSPTLLDFYC